MTRTKFVCFVAARNCMRQQVAGRSSQRHATLPTYYKILLRTEKVLLQYYPVVQSTPPYYSVLQSVLRTTKCYSSTTLYYTALLCSTNYYSSTTLYYKVLLQYYSVLQSATPVLLCTKVLLQYYFVLHSATPVLLCTTKYYSSTTLYYKVLIQYYSVLHSATPVLLCTTKYYSSKSLYYKVLLQYLHKKPTPTISFVYAIFFTSFGQRHAIFLFALGRSPQRHTTWHDAQRRGTTLGSQSATTHDCSVDAVRNDVRQLHITLFKVSGQDATN